MRGLTDALFGVILRIGTQRGRGFLANRYEMIAALTARDVAAAMAVMQRMLKSAEQMYRRLAGHRLGEPMRPRRFGLEERLPTGPLSRR